jgi:hypothetical protein
VSVDELATGLHRELVSTAASIRPFIAALLRANSKTASGNL